MNNIKCFLVIAKLGVGSNPRTFIEILEKVFKNTAVVSEVQKGSAIILFEKPMKDISCKSIQQQISNEGKTATMVFDVSRSDYYGSTYQQTHSLLTQHVRRGRMRRI